MAQPGARALNKHADATSQGVRYAPASAQRRTEHSAGTVGHVSGRSFQGLGQTWLKLGVHAWVGTLSDGALGCACMVLHGTRYGLLCQV